jgi:hypothetical protein
MKTLEVAPQETNPIQQSFLARLYPFRAKRILAMLQKI